MKGPCTGATQPLNPVELLPPRGPSCPSCCCRWAVRELLPPNEALADVAGVNVHAGAAIGHIRLHGSGQPR